MARVYRVTVRASGLPLEDIRSLAEQLANQPEVRRSVDELSTQLAASPLEVVSNIDLERANALRLIASASGATVEIQNTAGNEVEVARADTEQAHLAVSSGTVMGGFHAPPSNAGGGLDLDSLDASSLVLLDGTDESQPAPAPVATKPPEPIVDEASHASDDPRFRPPQLSADFGPDSENGALELDLSVGPASGEQRAITEPTEDLEEGYFEDLSSLNEPEVGQVVKEAPERGQRSNRQHLSQHLRRSARRRRLTVAAVAMLRERAHLRVVVGFLLALGLGAVLPTCHARSVMSTKVQELKLELATAKAHGVNATPAFDSVQQIEERISSVKFRHGTYSMLMWLAGSGLLLFLWFRFV